MKIDIIRHIRAFIKTLAMGFFAYIIFVTGFLFIFIFLAFFVLVYWFAYENT
jgi:hypothetical protein